MHRIAPLIILALCHVAANAQAPADRQSHDAPQGGVVVLHDGGVLAGRVKRENDRYLVAQGTVEMQIAADNVMLVAASLDEAYALRREKLSRPTVETHLQLAEWCLRHNLIAQAEREVRDAKQLEARHPRLALIERRLAVFRQLEQRAAGQPVDKTTAAATAVTPTSATQQAKVASRAELAIGDVPSRVVERFTRRVQPILVNNCTESGCHQKGGNESFQLDRALLHGLANRRSTMSNLAAALSIVDRNEPQTSPLLTVPRSAHGDMTEPIFGPRHEQAYRHLVEWVALVSMSDSEDTGLAATAELLDEARMGLQAPEASGANIVPANFAEVAPLGDVDEVSESDEVTQVGFDEPAMVLESAAPPTQPPRIGAQVQKWQPRDAFDPEIFNRQNRERRTPTAVEPAPANSAAPAND